METVGARSSGASFELSLTFAPFPRPQDFQFSVRLSFQFPRNPPTQRVGPWVYVSLAEFAEEVQHRVHQCFVGVQLVVAHFSSVPSATRFSVFFSGAREGAASKTF